MIFMLLGSETQIKKGGNIKCKVPLMQTKESQRRKDRQKSNVACMYSLQSFLVMPCFCLSLDIYLYLCSTSRWLSLHDIRKSHKYAPGNMRCVRRIQWTDGEAVKTLKKTFILGDGAFSARIHNHYLL